jgi:hypothetical protein
VEGCLGFPVLLGVWSGMDWGILLGAGLARIVALPIFARVRVLAVFGGLGTKNGYVVLVEWMNCG